MEQMQPQVQGIIPAYAGSTKSLRFEHVRDFRIIPAYAGSTGTAARSMPFCQGSSPHTRGAPSWASSRPATGWDHPRIRGEHLDDVEQLGDAVGIIPAYAGSTRLDTLDDGEGAGSSPHTRGARWRRWRPPRPRWDHPRIRGEHKSSR